ncbi:MAG: 50S ribosomal protein L23 [bacterium]|nr:50S ribosomal protein L23 [bacterium]
MQKHTGQIIISPRITEKGAILSDVGAYVFNVARDANKKEIATAVQTLFKVVPRMVRVVAVPRKQVKTRGRVQKGTTGGGKKAYVYLKKGDTIELV